MFRCRELQDTFTSALTMRINSNITDVFKLMREPRTQINIYKFSPFPGEKKPRTSFIPGRVVGRGGIFYKQSKREIAQFLTNFEWMHVGWHDCLAREQASITL